MIRRRSGNTAFEDFDTYVAPENEVFSNYVDGPYGSGSTSYPSHYDENKEADACGWEIVCVEDTEFAHIHPPASGEFSSVGPRTVVPRGEWICERLARLLTDDPLIDPSRVDIEVHEGSVRLSGEVPDEEMVAKIRDVASSMVGARRVTCEIRSARK
jgi:hypothetical protein